MQKNKEQDQLVRQTVGKIQEVSMQVGGRQELLQSLSAMMDDEAESLELRRVVKAAASDQELTATWGRYHAVRASIRQEMHQHARADLLAGIRVRLAVEPAVSGKLVGNRSVAGRLLKLAGQGAIAASVAAAVLFSFSLQTAPTGESAAAAQMADATAVQQELPALNGDFSASPLTRTVSMDAAARNRLEKAVRNYSGTTAVLDTATTPMFKTQLEPFAATSSATPPNSATPQNGQ